MKQYLTETLDECLALLQSGQATLGECLARYPDHAADLRPLLETAIEVKNVPRPTSRPTAFAAGKQRMLQTLAEKKRRQPVSPSPLSRYAGWMETLFGKKERMTMQKRIPVFKFAMAGATILVLLIAGGFTLRFWLSTAVAQTATLTDVSGVVQVMPTGTGAWQLAEPGSRITPGDSIRTGASSAVTLAFFDGSATTLDAETEVTVSQLFSRRDEHDKIIILHQWVGRTRNRVQRLLDPASRFEIETPTAVTAVRGTEFTVEVMPNGATRVAVDEGLVEVAARGTTVELESGEATTVQPDLPPAMPHPTFTAEPTETLEPTETEEPVKLTETPEPTETEEPAESTETPDADDDGDDGGDNDGDNDGDGGDDGGGDGGADDGGGDNNNDSDNDSDNDDDSDNDMTPTPTG